ncbi:MAG: DUF108 domain-containing protein [Rhodobacteraceae bacterium]|nr:DUF108 domain-containing protein [Paracoccaceae bacterium]MCF8513528.1 DUF108 domain-containing protein [Paracoccaceae bacterium]MCF8517572.1 DUF108 domain-containing protein [Paracoccaceae bacterium]
MVTTVNLIGQGAIGRAVAQWIEASETFDLQDVIARGQSHWPKADLAIDAAGPGALRALGPRLLAQGPLWTVGAAALIDPEFRGVMHATAQASGHALRLFTGWIAGPDLLPASQTARLHIAQSAPGLGPASGLLFDGPLAQAAQRFPDHLNTATAAALCGPGIDATWITLTSAPEGGAHRIEARFETPNGLICTTVTFGTPAVHPVAAAIIAALERREAWLTYR